VRNDVTKKTPIPVHKSEATMIHSKIRKLRENLGLTQETMAEYLCISQNAYSLIEKGKTKIDIDRLLQITKKLNIRPSVLIDNEIIYHKDPSATTIQLKASLDLKDKLIQKLIQQNSLLIEQLKKKNVLH
jgi:transcriptional regulator with XRE-family HTH domain